MNITNSYSLLTPRIIQSNRAGEVYTPSSGQVAVDHSNSPDTVSISPEAKHLADTEQGSLLRNLKMMTLDPQEHIDHARQCIQSVLSELGVSPDTPVSITTNAYGEVSYEVDHPEGEKIAEQLSADPALNNFVVGAQSTAALQRIAKAAREAFDSVPNGNDEAVSRALAWVQSFSQQTLEMDYQLQYTGGKMSASFVDESGVVVDYMNNFTVPKFA